MRYKHILLFTTLALLVHGCSSNPNNIELSDEQRLEKEAREYAEKQTDNLYYDMMALDLLPQQKKNLKLNVL